MRYQEERQLEEQRAQVGARMKQYEDELARKRLMSEHELQRQVRRLAPVVVMIPCCRLFFCGEAHRGRQPGELCF